MCIRDRVDTKILKPQRGEKKQLVNLAIKNARVSLEQKFNLLEKSVEKTQGAIENLGRLLQIPTPVRIESFDTSNICLLYTSVCQTMEWTNCPAVDDGGCACGGCSTF